MLLAHRSWADWLTLAATHVAGGRTVESGPIVAATTGVPIPLFNQAIVSDVPSGADVRRACDALVGAGVPCWLTVPEPLLAQVEPMAAAAGFVPSGATAPGMVLDDLAGVAAAPDVERVAEPEVLAEAAAVVAEAFGAPLEAALVMTPPSSLDEPDAAWFTVRDAGEVVACGQLLVSGPVAGVYSIAVRASHRRRGLGEAVTSTVLATGRERGCTLGVLQSSDIGRRVYERLGFVDLVRYHHLEPAPR